MGTGRHRKNGGCLGAVLVMAGIVGAFAYGAYEGIRGVLS